MIRMWVNQPSKLQMYHSLHGINVLAEESVGEFTDIWFLNGEIISQGIHKSALSIGWKNNTLHNILFKIDADGNNYYAGFEYTNNAHNCSWSFYQPMLIPDDELEDCIRDIRESYTGELLWCKCVGKIIIIKCSI